MQSISIMDRGQSIVIDLHLSSEEILFQLLINPDALSVDDLKKQHQFKTYPLYHSDLLKKLAGEAPHERFLLSLLESLLRSWITSGWVIAAVSQRVGHDSIQDDFYITMILKRSS